MSFLFSCVVVSPTTLWSAWRQSGRMERPRFVFTSSLPLVYTAIRMEASFCFLCKVMPGSAWGWSQSSLEPCSVGIQLRAPKHTMSASHFESSIQSKEHHLNFFLMQGRDGLAVVGGYSIFNVGRSLLVAIRGPFSMPGRELEAPVCVQSTCALPNFFPKSILFHNRQHTSHLPSARCYSWGVGTAVNSFYRWGNWCTVGREFPKFSWLRNEKAMKLAFVQRTDRNLDFHNFNFKIGKTKPCGGRASDSLLTSDCGSHLLIFILGSSNYVN